jgi:MoaA/NifB/PqqE/SkfB family radical SAM enzyme
MRKFNVIGLMYTRTCPLVCEHCITESSPHVKDHMPFHQAFDYLHVIRDFCPQLCFSGGEPFIYYRDMVTLTQEAKSLGLRVSVVTGAGWVRKETQTRMMVKTLADAGLVKLGISWDKYHEKFSSRDNAVMLAKIATDLGLQVEIRIVRSRIHTEDWREIFVDLPVEIHEIQIVPLGRAASLEPTHFSSTDEKPRGMCGVVLSPVIEPNGNVYACCGPSRYCRKPSPLFLGNAVSEPLREILERALNDPILEIIYNLGPYGLYQLLKDHSVGRERFKPRSNYKDICELCLDITNDPEIVDAVRQRVSELDAQRLIAAARLWRANNPGQDKDDYAAPKVRLPA